MIIAYVIMLGHSVIPHHHHESNHELAEHHQTEHHHDDEADSEGLNHLFSHFLHAADGFTFITVHNFNNTFSKQLLSVFAVLPANYLIAKFIILPLIYKPPAELLVSSSPHFLSSGLRAPPALIA